MNWYGTSTRHELLIQRRGSSRGKGKSGFYMGPRGRQGWHQRARQGDNLPDCYWQDYPDAPRAPFPMCFTHQALECLVRSVGTRYPETGAKGFGPKDAMGFDVIEFDRAGSRYARGSAYAPDVEWGEQRRIHHLSQPDHAMRLWTGDAHSHPGYSGRPSSASGRGLGDMGYALQVLEENEWMEWFMIPILTGTASGEVTLHPWVVHRFAPERPMIAEGVEVCDVSDFPSRSFNPVWEQEAASATEAAEAQPEPMSISLESAEAAPLTRTYRATLGVQARRALERAYAQQLAGEVSPEFRHVHIMVVGLETGSRAVEELVRLAPGQLTLCDDGQVELHRIPSTAFTVQDALSNSTRATAMAQRIMTISPLVDVYSCEQDFAELDRRQRESLLDGVDIIIAGSTALETLATVNLEAVERGIPAVFMGADSISDGGRVVAYLPGRTGCYGCAAYEHYLSHELGVQPSSQPPEASVGRLDRSMLGAIAAQLALGILERDRCSHAGGLLEGVGNCTDITVGSASMGPGAEWQENPPDPRCPVCGENVVR